MPTHSAKGIDSMTIIVSVKPRELRIEQ